MRIDGAGIRLAVAGPIIIAVMAVTGADKPRR